MTTAKRRLESLIKIVGKVRRNSRNNSSKGARKVAW